MKALEGSPCDTIRPIAQFSYQSDALTIDFQDESLRNPTKWFWTFGDGTNSEQQHPMHTYLTSGMHEVCLTVSNEAGSDSICQEVDILIDDLEELSIAKLIKIYPNPTKGNVLLELPFQRNENWVIEIYDTFGRVLLEKEIKKDIFIANIFLNHFSSGIYFYEIKSERQIFKTGKIILE